MDSFGMKRKADTSLENLFASKKKKIYHPVQHLAKNVEDSIEGIAKVKLELDNSKVCIEKLKKEGKFTQLKKEYPNYKKLINDSIKKVSEHYKEFSQNSRNLEATVNAKKEEEDNVLVSNNILSKVTEEKECHENEEEAIMFIPGFNEEEEEEVEQTKNTLVYKTVSESKAYLREKIPVLKNLVIATKGSVHVLNNLCNEIVRSEKNAITSRGKTEEVQLNSSKSPSPSSPPSLSS